MLGRHGHAVLLDRQVQVAVRGVRQDLPQPGGVRRLHGGHIEPVVPVAGDLLRRQDRAPFLHQVVAVHLDVVEQFEVALGPAELDAGLRPGRPQPAGLHEQPLLLGVDDPRDVRAGRQREPGPDPGDLGVDELHPPLAGDGHPMVPVDQEVPPVHLVDLDRREVPAGERTFDALPPVLDVGAAGQELSVERVGPIQRPHDAADRDRTDAHVRLIEQAEPVGDLLQGEQLLGVLVPDLPGEVPEGLAAPGPLVRGGRVGARWGLARRHHPVRRRSVRVTGSLLAACVGSR